MMIPGAGAWRGNLEMSDEGKRGLLVLEFVFGSVMVVPKLDEEKSNPEFNLDKVKIN